MNRHWLHPANMAAAAVLLGGVLAAAAPQHAPSVVRLVIVAVSAAAGLYVVASSAPPRWWRSPFEAGEAGGVDEGSARGAGAAGDDLRWIRSALAAPRQRIPNGPPLPPEAIGMLQPLIRAALERRGVPAGTAPSAAQARTVLSPLARAVLAATPLRRPPWYRLLPPDARQAAGIVVRLLDDLERAAAGAPPLRTPTRTPGAT